MRRKMEVEEEEEKRKRKSGNKERVEVAPSERILSKHTD